LTLPLSSPPAGGRWPEGPEGRVIGAERRQFCENPGLSIEAASDEPLQRSAPPPPHLQWGGEMPTLRPILTDRASKLSGCLPSPTQTTEPPSAARLSAQSAHPPTLFGRFVALC
jgi:hypothetical protein